MKKKSTLDQKIICTNSKIRQNKTEKTFYSKTAALKDLKQVEKL